MMFYHCDETILYHQLSPQDWHRQALYADARKRQKPKTEAQSSRSGAKVVLVNAAGKRVSGSGLDLTGHKPFIRDYL